MMIISVLRFLFFLLHLFILTATATAPYKPTDYFLLSCGSASNTAFNGRNWDTDARLKFLPPDMADVSSAATALVQGPSVDQVPYTTARIFHSQFSYTFPLSPGRKFLRLYFYPATYSGGLNGTQAFFTVTANGYTLLSNFSAFLTVYAADRPKPTLVKEFVINVKENQILNLTFIPSSDSYSFVNGIEIVSMPDDLYLREQPSPKSVDQQSLFPFDKNNTAFETLYRLNVGGTDVPVVEDTGMFRGWSQDDIFIYGSAHGNPLFNNITIRYTSQTPSYTAPEKVYVTARAMGKLADRYKLIWLFPVDSGFFYLLRLHFCEILTDIVKSQNQRVFTILINNKTAESEFDVMYYSSGHGIPIYRDYVVWVPINGRPSKQEIWLAMYPAEGTQFADTILNGLEIFKLNSSEGNLAGPNPELLVIPNAPGTNRKETKRRSSRSRTTVYAAVGGAAGAAGLLFILVFLIFRRRRRLKDLETITTESSWAPPSMSSRSTKTNGSSLPSDLCLVFLLGELKSATADFNDNFVIGRGGFGSVYKGCINNGATTVAIKRLNPSSSQGAREFTTEIEMLSKLRHLHLVSLIGYCEEQGEMILVYDYMGNGTLRDHLYKTKKPPMPWKQRLQICIGAAKGLHYLHGGAKHKIIHRDVKSTNILLDDKWVAKVSDFGLSRVGPTNETQSHVSTVVKGSFGYVDPEYYKRQQLTDKSDVYSFGVVLFEVLCARPAIMPHVPKEQVNLAEWARRNYRSGSLEEIIDPKLKGEIAEECLRTYAEIAFSCLKDRGVERPAMNDVVWSLEFALQLQEAAENNGALENPRHPLLLDNREVITTTDDEVFSGSGKSAAESNSGGTTTSGSDKLKSKTVFSEIMNPAGR